MPRFIQLFLVTLFSSLLLVSHADAKRLGGGKSFGQQRQNMDQQMAPKTPPAQSAAPAAGAPAGNRWLGPLAGLAAGGLLAAMFMGGAFEGIKFMDILMLLGIAALIFFVIRAMRRPRPAPAMNNMQYAAHGPAPVLDALPEQTAGGFGGGGARAFSTRPSWFNEENFTRLAKGHFIRLQAANDAKDLNDIREYTTPEVYAEISLQIQERGDAPQHTEVLSVDARVLDVVTAGDLVTASVRYTGQLREEVDGPVESFDEIWHVQRSLNESNANWYIAGIQQTPLSMALTKTVM